jgi:hypothetical protein
MPLNHWLSLIALLAVVSSGCFGGPRVVPGPALPLAKNQYTWGGLEETRSGSANKYCDDVEHALRGSSQKLGILGWTLSVVSVGSIATGAIVAGASGAHMSEAEKAVAIGAPVLAALATLGALAAFDRQEGASNLAREAALAVGTKNAARTCTAAVADWNGARSQSADGVRNELQKP